MWVQVVAWWETLAWSPNLLELSTLWMWLQITAHQPPGHLPLPRHPQPQSRAAPGWEEVPRIPILGSIYPISGGSAPSLSPNPLPLWVSLPRSPDEIPHPTQAGGASPPIWAPSAPLPACSTPVFLPQHPLPAETRGSLTCRRAFSKHHDGAQGTGLQSCPCISLPV